MNVVTMSGEVKFQGDVGPRGPKGEKGDKPVAGVDYYTKSEKEQFLAEITDDASSVFNQNVQQKTSDFNTNATNKTNSFNTNANEKTEDFTEYTAQKKTEFESYVGTKTEAFNSNATSKTTSFNSNVTSQLNTFNSNANTKQNQFNTNVTQKTDAFDENAEQQTKDFNENVSDKTTEFNNNVAQKTTAFDNNAVEKTTAFDTNVESKTTVFNENAVKETNAFNENAQNKLDEFNSSANIERITTLETQVEKLEKKVDQAENILPTTTASGENVYIDNAQSYPLMGLSGEGKCEQVTTTGKNAIEVDTQIEFIATMTWKEITVQNYNFKTDTTYFLNIECDIGTTKKIWIGNNDELFVNAARGSFKLTQEQIDSITKVVFVIEGLTAGTTYKGNAYVMISENENDTFEPYTGGQASPNPDYPQEITTVTEAEYKGVGKNYFNIGVKEDYFRTSTNGSMITNTSLNAIDFTIENNKLTINSYDNTGYPWLSKWVNLEKNTDYTVSFLTNVSSLKIFGTNSEEVGSIGELVYNTESTTKKYFNSGEYEYYFVSFYPYKADTYFENIQIEKGTESTPYEPYQESTLPIDLQGNELCKVGDVADKLLIDRKGNVAIEKNIEKLVLNGSEAWIIDGLQSGLSYRSFTHLLTNKPLVEAGKNGYIISNKLIKLDGQLYYDDNEGIEINWNERIRIKILNSDLISEYALKNWLVENPIITYYVLATPEIINLGTIENPEIFKGINNITVETNLGNMLIDVEYVEDLQVRLEKVEQAIISLGGI